MSEQRIVIYCSTFDPPTVHHRHIAQELAERFDRVIIAPAGPRPRNSSVPDSLPISRATMTDLNFRDLAKVEVDLSDIEDHHFSTVAELYDRYNTLGVQVWHVVNTDWVRGGAQQNSTIHKEWPRGPEQWNRAGFVVLREAGEPIDEADMPPNHIILQHAPHIPSNTVRLMISQCDPVESYLHPPVAAYLERYGLFRDVALAEQPTFRPRHKRFRLAVDEWNERARNYGQILEPYTTGEPELIVPIGGDGTMLRAIRKHWRERIPFFGINTGHLGFLLSGRDVTSLWEKELLVYQLPLLRVEAELVDGSTETSIAFNEAWVERATGQTAWVKISVNGVVRFEQMVGDGVLVSTAAGSTSYARGMGASPVPLSTQVLLLVGSNVLKPAYWRPAVLPIQAEITLETVHMQRRPLKGYCDGEAFAQNIKRLHIRVSRTAAIELAFTRDHDPFEKLAMVQFPLGQATPKYD